MVGKNIIIKNMTDLPTPPLYTTNIDAQNMQRLTQSLDLKPTNTVYEVFKRLPL